jgi:3-methyladenine DNA glycosylase AlkD
MNDIIESLRQELIKNADEKTKASGERFFREKVKLYGIKSAVVSRIGREYFNNLTNRSKTHVFNFCEELWKSGIMEESFVACNWSYFVRKQYESSDFRIFEGWINSYVTNWASCDTFCNHTVGSAVEMFPEKIAELKKWALSQNRWMRRASAVSLIVPARKGMFLKDIFEISDILLPDADDMVQKGYGWMLKSASKPYQKEVFEYVLRNKKVMPRTSLRYAIEKMSDELKMVAMAK